MSEWIWGSTPTMAAVLDGPVPRGKPFSVTTTREGFEELLRRATEGAEGPSSSCLSPRGWPGFRWQRMCRRRARGIPGQAQKGERSAEVPAPARQEQLGRCGGQWALASGGSQGVHPLSLPTAEQMTLRRLVKRRERLVQQASDGKREIYALMVMANPPLMAALGESAFGDAAMAFYRRYADPQQVVNWVCRGCGSFGIGRAGARPMPDSRSGCSKPVRRPSPSIASNDAAASCLSTT